MGNVAKSSSRRCFTLVKVTTPTAPRTPLPTKFAVAEKHTARFLRREDYIYHRKMQSPDPLPDPLLAFIAPQSPTLRWCHTSPMEPALPVADAATLRHIRRIQTITIVWMTVEAGVSLSAAWMAHSPAL